MKAVSLEERERRAVMKTVDLRLHMDRIRDKQYGPDGDAMLADAQQRADALIAQHATLPGQADRIMKMADVTYRVMKELETLPPEKREKAVDEVRKAFLNGGTKSIAQYAKQQAALESSSDPRKYEKQTRWAMTVWGRVHMRDWMGTERHKAFVAGIDPARPADEVVAEVLGELTASIQMDPAALEQTLKEVMPMFIASLQWSRAGYPVFSLTDDFFHALAVTDFGTHEDDKDDVLHLPFPAFIVNFPPNAILADARKMFVYPAFGGTTRLTLVTHEPAVTYWPTDITRWDFVRETEWRKSAAVTPEHSELLTMARRILANMLSYIDASHGLPKEKHKHGAPAAPVEREHTEPRFRVGRPVKLSPQIRQVLKEGRQGKSWKLGHRFIVRGHFRNQAHGPNRSLRTRKWIEPFWKGPASMTEAFERSYSVE